MAENKFMGKAEDLRIIEISPQHRAKLEVMIDHLPSQSARDEARKALAEGEFDTVFAIVKGQSAGRHHL